MTTIKHLITFIEQQFPPQVQESYDNSGIITGNINDILKGVILTIDIDEEVVQEAIDKNCNMIIAHHPIIFRPLHSLTGKNYIERTVIKAIKNDIAIYAAHTSVDNSYNGLNKIICDILNVKNTKIIDPKPDLLYKLITFVPSEYVNQVKTAIFEAGAGKIGNYDSCSFSTKGTGSFKAGDNTNPFVGKKNIQHFEEEVRIETIFPSFLKNKIINQLINSHPYEEPAFDIYPLINKHQQFGAGLIGELNTETDEIEFLQQIKQKLKIKCLKHSEILGKKIKKVAVCTGAGSFLMYKAMTLRADIFIAAEFKYNQFLDAKNEILIVDAGHYETEIFIKNIFYELITKNFTNFAVEFSQKFSNPVKSL
ncbi:MAG: Nif3-like dinuclear metal center hexameric protein [Bacteroidales bacterium]|nr:Nif3-like dinuclear metal center hexameric protein [Bacteroidales bacterium]